MLSSLVPVGAPVAAGFHPDPSGDFRGLAVSAGLEPLDPVALVVEPLTKQVGQGNCLSVDTIRDFSPPLQYQSCCSGDASANSVGQSLPGEQVGGMPASA